MSFFQNSKSIMLVAGYNGDNRLGEKSNAKDNDGDQCIFPPCNSNLTISSLLSFSNLGDHSVWITKDHRAFAIGSNEEGQIINTLKKEIIRKEQEITLFDPKGRKCQFISAVCGYYYTLYLVSSESERNNQLVLFYRNKNSGKPLFLNMNGHNPIHLFGGNQNAAAVGAEGEIFVITEAVFDRGSSPIASFVLPGGEKAVSVACCISFIAVAGSRGGLFLSGVPDLAFEKVSGFDGEEVAEVSGTGYDCIAVCKSGRVFGRGPNIYGQLGLGKGRKSEAEFTEILSLKPHRIISAAAGDRHSLFITAEGKILACGRNLCGGLLVSSGPSNDYIYEPVATTITSGATFCIAGCDTSVVFASCEPPPNTPNMTIKAPEKSSKALDDRLKDLEEENARLKAENASLRRENDDLKRSSSGSEKPPTNKSIQILDSSSISDYEIIDKIGSGGGGQVYKVFKKVIFAMKEMNVKKGSTKSFQHFISEYELINLLEHINIIKTYGIFLSDSRRPPSIIFEFCPENMEDKINSKSATKIFIAFSIYQIAEGMKFVHFRKIIHRDLKPSNILIASDGTIKISDFGIAKLMTPDESMTLNVGTQKFMAPELLNEEDYDEKVDVYAFGVLMYFMLSGGELPRISVVQVGNGKKAKIPDDFTSLSRKIIDMCWSFRAKDRPSFDDIINLLVKDRFKTVDLSDSEVKEVTRLVDEHRKRLPKY